MHLVTPDEVRTQVKIYMEYQASREMDCSRLELEHYIHSQFLDSDLMRVLKKMGELQAIEDLKRAWDARLDDALSALSSKELVKYNKEKSLWVHRKRFNTYLRQLKAREKAERQIRGGNKLLELIKKAGGNVQKNLQVPFLSETGNLYKDMAVLVLKLKESQQTEAKA